MAVPPHTLCTWKGVFGSVAAPVETWQFSLKMSNDPLHEGFSEAQFQALAEALGAAWEDALTIVQPPWVTLTETRFVLVGGDGLTERRGDGSLKQGVTSQNAVGATANAQRMPLQTALVASLVTNRQGPTGKGRIFLPHPGYALNASFALDEGFASTVANQVVELINNCNAIGGGSVHVYSSKGYATPVTGVRVGRVLDTMRSRRRAQLEEYVADNVALTQ